MAKWPQRKMNEKKSQPPDSRVDALQQLKSILLSEDHQRAEALEARLSELEQQLEQKERLIEVMEPVLVDLLNREIRNKREEVARALAPVMSEAIKQQIQDAKEDMVDALYPILGRMVSKAVAEAIRKLTEQINQTLERSFNWELWVRRFKARFLGVDPAKMIIAGAAPFKLEGVFLIAKNSGLLIAYAQREDGPERHNNAHVIGGMLTAIKSFMETSFQDSAAPHPEDLEEIRMSDRQVRILTGRYSYLAVVYSGVPTPAFDKLLRNCHEVIHKRYHQKLRQYDGDNSKLKGIDAPLKKVIRKMRAEEEKIP